jgi:glycosyltransferase involved in cell wall biosynthesis
MHSLAFEETNGRKAIMKIAQVTAYWGPAYPTGSGVFCYEISKRLAQQFEVHVFTSSIGNFNNQCDMGNFHIHPLRTYATMWDMNPIADVFTKLLRDDFDIVHVHSYIFFLSNMAALAKIFKRKSKYILHFNGGLDFSKDTRSFHPMRIWAKENIYDRTLGYFTAKLADMVFSTSKNDIPIIQRKFGIKEVEWIPNAVDTKKFIPAADKPNPPVVTYVGKLEKWKGIDTLIKSFETINKQAKNVKFLVAGTGSLEGKLREAKLPIELLGPVPYEKMPAIYQGTSVVILPSYMEGFPCTCIEALSCEVPVVATDVGDVKEIVVDKETGFVAEPGDSGEIASRTVEILKDEGLRRKLGRNGRAHVERNFGYEALIPKIVGEYEKCLKQRPPKLVGGTLGVQER